MQMVSFDALFASAGAKVEAEAEESALEAREQSASLECFSLPISNHRGSCF